MSYKEFALKSEEMKQRLTNMDTFESMQAHKLTYIMYLPLLKEIEELKERVKLLEEPDEKE